MKIFNWMNRKFSSKDGRSSKKDDEFILAKEMDKKPLIGNVSLEGLIDVDWKDNLLAIGTLGFDQFHKFIPDEDYFNDHLFPDQNEEESENDDDEYQAEEFFDQKNNDEDDEGTSNFLLPVIANMQSGIVKGDEMKSINGNTVEAPTTNGIVDCGIKKDEKDCKIKKKMTLAELFSAESTEEMKGHNNEKDQQEKTMMMSKCTSGHSKNKLSNTKKIIPGVSRVHARLARKLNQMVTRMMKRKIHPDPVISQGKHQKDKHNKTSIFGHQLSVKHSINETVSLLRTRDVEI